VVFCSWVAEVAVARAVLPIDIYLVSEIFLRHSKDHRADLEFARGFGVTSLVDTTCVFSLSFGPTVFEAERGLYWPMPQKFLFFDNRAVGSLSV
jgi:hypothetical protein